MFHIITLEKGLHTTLTDPGEIRERCGVYITKAGKVQFDVGASPANAATVAVAAEVADSSSQTVVEAADLLPAAPAVSKESVQAEVICSKCGDHAECKEDRACSVLDSLYYDILKRRNKSPNNATHMPTNLPR